MMERRDFIKTGVMGAIGGMAAVRYGFGSDSSDVYITSAAPEQGVRKVIDAMGGMSRFVQPDSMVAIKPNMSFPNPAKWSTTTSPEVVKAVVDLCLEAGAKRVFVIENPMQADADQNLKRTGIQDAITEENGVQFLMLKDERKYEEVAVQGVKELTSVKVAKILSKVDCFVNVPVAKSHRETSVSMGLKNLMGVIWDRQIFHEQLDLHRALGELIAYVRPDLTIMDATRGLLTNGPEGPGKVGNIGKIIASDDMLAVDAVTVTQGTWNRMVLQPADVLHLRHAAGLGRGIIDMDRINQIQVT
jgi:uncharacterized protein (DUF362 family)